MFMIDHQPNNQKFREHEAQHADDGNHKEIHAQEGYKAIQDQSIENKHFLCIAFLKCIVY